MPTVEKIMEAIEARAAYIETFVGIRTLTSYNDNTGWCQTVGTNPGSWTTQSFMVCRSDIQIDPLKLQCYREEHVEPRGTCPACNGSNDIELPGGLKECAYCGCLHGQTYLGESYRYVKPQMISSREADQRAKPFDITCLGSKGITRRHGFYDPKTKCITQVG